MMVAGAHQHDCFGIKSKRSEGDSRRSVPRRRFDHDGRLTGSQLGLDMFDVAGARNHQRLAKAIGLAGPLNRGLEQCSIPQHRQERLGLYSPAARPKPGAATAA